MKVKELGIERIKNILREIQFFENFTSNDLNSFARQLSLRSVSSGTILFKQGDIGDYLLFVVEGNVEVRLESLTTKHVIASYGWGSCVGEMSIIDDYPRSATVIVTEPSELLILSKHRFESIVEEHPEIGVKILKGLSRNLCMRLRGATGRFADLA